MKKRLFLILLGIIIGIGLIEVYLRYSKPLVYEEMEYRVYYETNENFPEKLFLETNYYDYYFNHFDENSYVLYKNGKKFSLMEAIENGYLLLGDLQKEVDIRKDAKFFVEVKENRKQGFTYKLTKFRDYIYYYNIEEVKILHEKTNEEKDLLEIIKNGEFNINDIIIYLENNGIEKEVQTKYEIYKSEDFILIINTEYSHYYLGNSDLTLDIIKDVDP